MYLHDPHAFFWFSIAKEPARSTTMNTPETFTLNTQESGVGKQAGGTGRMREDAGPHGTRDAV